MESDCFLEDFLLDLEILLAIFGAADSSYNCKASYQLRTWYLEYKPQQPMFTLCPLQQQEQQQAQCGQTLCNGCVVLAVIPARKRLSTADSWRQHAAFLCFHLGPGDHILEGNPTPRNARQDVMSPCHHVIIGIITEKSNLLYITL